MNERHIFRDNVVLVISPLPFGWGHLRRSIEEFRENVPCGIGPHRLIFPGRESLAKSRLARNKQDEQDRSKRFFRAENLGALRWFRSLGQGNLPDFRFTGEVTGHGWNNRPTDPGIGSPGNVPGAPPTPIVDATNS